MEKLPPQNECAGLGERSPIDRRKREGRRTRRPSPDAQVERIAVVAHSRPRPRASPDVIDVKLLGRFTLTLGGRSIGQWPRPSARRLCQIVLSSPGRRVGREPACRALFPALGGEAAARSLYRALSMARITLRELGPQAGGLLRADPNQIWADPGLDLAVDLDMHERALRTALLAEPGLARDSNIVQTLATRGIALEDELEAEWADAVQDRVEYLRQEARLELARDRWRGIGRPVPRRCWRHGRLASRLMPPVRRPPQRSCGHTWLRAVAPRPLAFTSAAVGLSPALG